jgi:chromate reductase
MKVLAISGSLRRASHNTRLLRAAAELAPAGLEVELFEGLRDVPPYDEDVDRGAEPAGVAALRRAIESADALLFSTPEYNGSVPGVLKNAVDWASRPVREGALQNKTVAVVGATTGQFGAMWAQADLRKALGLAGARVVGDELPVARVQEKLDAQGNLVDAELAGRLRLLLETLRAEIAPAGDGGGASGERKGAPYGAPDPVTSGGVVEALPPSAPSVVLDSRPGGAKRVVPYAG